jgi:hypothetical protein
MKLKIRIEELIIGGLLGGGVGAAVTSPLAMIAGPLPGFTPAAMAGEPLWAVALHALMLGAAVASAAAGAFIAGRQESEQHIRGMRFYRDPAEAAAVLQGLETPRMSPAQRAGKVRGLVIGGLEFSRSREAEHALVLGLPGGGKTAGVLRPALDQVLARGDRVLLHDPKGDFCQTHFNPATTVLLGPWDARSVIWNAAADIDSPALADEFAASVCGVADSGQNRYFHQGAATILGGLIKSYQRLGAGWTWAQLGEALRADPVSLIRRAAEGDPLVRQAVPSVWAPVRGKIELTVGERSVLSTLGNASRMLLQLAAVDATRPDATKFSLRAWLLGTDHTEIKLALMNNSALYKSAVEAIFGAMLAVVSATVSAALPEKSADDDGALWCIIDEGKQAGATALECLQVIAEVGRSRGVRVWLGLQDAGQLAAAVGREKAEPMMSMQGTRIYLRAAPDSAENIARTVGEREIQRIQNTASGGAVQGKTATYDRVPVLAPSDLTGLKTTRLPDETADIEMLVAIEDVIGLLVKNSGPRPARIAAQFEPCPAWRMGLPPEQQPQIAPQPTPPATDGRAPQPQAPACDPDIESPFTDTPAPEPDEPSPFDDPSPAQDGDAIDWTKE